MRADEAQTMLYGFAAGAFLNSATNNAVNCSAQAQGLSGAAAAQASQQGQGNNDQKILTKRGRATYELKTNTLIITDTPRKIQEIRELLARLDVPARQVMIEARVVIADSNWSRELGVRLGTRLFKNTGRDAIGVGGTLNESASIAAGGTPTVTPQVGLGTLGTAAGQIALSVLNRGNGNLLSLELSALEADNRGKILSNPRVMTTNQKPAVILNGTQIPFITPGSANSPATVSFKDAFLCLLVDPQILNNDSLIMTVEVQKDAIDTSNAAVGAGINAPAIATRRIKTQVRVNNGETLVLGGIFDQTEFNNVDKVPFLGDVPLLGNLFKRTSRQDQKTELIVFITPRILDDRLSIR
jgi:type IV pilus assembly protein PilQ